ncbi:unnamed protein product, partial [marine sediment metagenome]
VPNGATFNMKRLGNLQFIHVFKIYENKSSGNQFSILQNDYLEVNKTLE